MTTSARVSNKTIDIVFSVSSFIFPPNFLITLNLCLQRCDTDGNGKLDYQEFKEMIFRSKARKEEAIKEEEKDIKKKGKVVKKEATKKGKKSKGKK